MSSQAQPDFGSTTKMITKRPVSWLVILCVLQVWNPMFAVGEVSETDGVLDALNFQAGVHVNVFTGLTFGLNGYVTKYRYYADASVPGLGYFFVSAWRPLANGHVQYLGKNKITVTESGISESVVPIADRIRVLATDCIGFHGPSNGVLIPMFFELSNRPWSSCCGLSASDLYEFRHDSGVLQNSLIIGSSYDIPMLSEKILPSVRATVDSAAVCGEDNPNDVFKKHPGKQASDCLIDSLQIDYEMLCFSQCLKACDCVGVNVIIGATPGGQLTCELFCQPEPVTGPFALADNPQSTFYRRN